jgi:type VI secretion system protein ImpF
VRRLKKSIARDLELLLNTRMELLDPLPDGYSEATRSILTYGLPDLTLLTASSHKDRNKVRRIIEQAVDIFEPRLKNVRVIVDQPRERERVLTFRIEAVIPVEPTPELVAFDTDFQLFSRKYVVKGNA